MSTFSPELITTNYENYDLSSKWFLYSLLSLGGGGVFGSLANDDF